MMRYTVAVLALLSFAAGQESAIRGGTGRGAEQELQRTLETVDEEIENAKALIMKEEATLQELENDIAQADDEEVPDEDLFQLSITLSPHKPCLARNMDQILLAVMRVGFMDLDACFDDVEEDKTFRRLIEEAHDEEEAHRLLQGGAYKFHSHGCRRCRNKRGKKRRRGTNMRRALEADLPIFQRNLLENYSSDDLVDDQNLPIRIENSLEIALVETFAQNPNNCLAEITVEDFELGFAIGGGPP